MEHTPPRPAGVTARPGRHQRAALARHAPRLLRAVRRHRAAQARETDGDRQAPRGLRHRIDCGVVGHGDRPYDREPQPVMAVGACRASSTQPLEGLEQSVGLLGGTTGPVLVTDTTACPLTAAVRTSTCRRAGCSAPRCRRGWPSVARSAPGHRRPRAGSSAASSSRPWRCMSGRGVSSTRPARRARSTRSL